MFIHPKNETLNSLRWYFIATGLLMLVWNFTLGFESEPSFKNVTGTPLVTTIGLISIFIAFGFIYFGTVIKKYLQPKKSYYLKIWVVSAAILSLLDAALIYILGNSFNFVGTVVELFILWYLLVSIKNLSKG